MAKVVWGADLYKGVTLKNGPGMMRLADFAPYQMLEELEKTQEWLMSVTDHFEALGWRNVEKKSEGIQKNYWLRQGILNPGDYLINPTDVHLAQAMQLVGADGHSTSPLQQFYPLIPTYVDLLRGEFLKRDNTFGVTQIDQGAVVEALNFKEDKIMDVMEKLAIAEKAKGLAKMGITEQDPESFQKYQEVIQETLSTFNETEAKFKNFRTTGAKWADKVLKIQYERYNLTELEPDAFDCGLTTDGEFWHLDLLEDDFKLELLNPKWCDYHKAPGTKYVSDGDYFLWFDWGSVGDIINKYGKIMKGSDLEKLKTTYASILNAIVVPDHEKTMQGSYYDVKLPYKQASDLNAPMNDAILGKELAYNFSQNSNFTHSIFDPAGTSNMGMEPKMFRIMNLYFRGMKKIGWLTKVGDEGNVEYADWVDENFRVSVEPVYDHSLLKEKSAKNLLRGEHVEWTWVNDWRRVIKISANTKHSFWKSNTDFAEIYLDGKSVKFQFKGVNNPYESKPPVEGCDFSWINAKAYGFVDRLKSFQVLYNIAMNKVPKAMANDKGLKVSINQGTILRNSADQEAGLNPLEVFEENLDSSNLLPYNLTREHLDLGMGQPALPQVLNLSTAEIAQFYLGLAQQIKLESGEVVGITRNRAGQNKASETAYGVQAGINYSEAQTEKYFENHYNLMKRVRQRMLDAAQYYTTFKESSREMYLNEKQETTFLEMEGMKNLLPHYQINIESTSKTRALLQMLTNFLVQENTLPFKPGEKVKALVSNSVPKIIELIEKSEIEARIIEKENQAHEMEKIKAQQEAQAAAFEAERQLSEEHDNRMTVSAKEIAEIRALGGMQTDANADGAIDAKTNLDYILKERALQNQAEANKSKLEHEESKRSDEVFLRNKEIDAKIKDTNTKLAIAKENRTNAEIKARKK